MQIFGFQTGKRENYLFDTRYSVGISPDLSAVFSNFLFFFNGKVLQKKGKKEASTLVEVENISRFRQKLVQTRSSDSLQGGATFCWLLLPFIFTVHPVPYPPEGSDVPLDPFNEV